MEKMTAKQFEDSCKKLKTITDKTDELVDSLIRHAIYHSVVNNQSTPAITLVASLGKSSRRNDVISFLCKYANIQFSKEKGIMSKMKTQDTIKECWKDEEKSLAYAAALPSFWDEIKEQRVKTEWDFEFALHNLVRSYRSAMNKGLKTSVKESDQVILNDLLSRFPAKA